MLTRLLLGISLASALAYPDLLFRNVAIVDVARGVILPKNSILIRADRIAEIRSDISASQETRVVEGAGKFVIPGLWDMHVHLTGREQLPVYLAHGVTGVRDMGSDFELVKQWRGAIQKGMLLGPRIETSGPVIDGFPAENPSLPVNVVRDPREARSVFDRLDDQGVDFISVFPRLPRDAYFALAERARKYYSFVSGTVPATVSILEAIDARQKSIDRMSGILLACSTEEKKLRPIRSLALERRDWEGFRDAEIAAMNSFSPEKANALFHHMALFETRSVPMLVDLRASPRQEGLFDMLVHVLMLMRSAGVRILAGTDAGQGDIRPGETLHQELELLVAAGLTPAEALRDATLEPARYLDATDSLGTVEPGKIADLVLLDANPLADIRNTRKIAAVISAGKFLPGTSPVGKSM
jgi:hypothetical protein